MDEEERRIRRKLRDDFEHYANKCLKLRSKSGEIFPLKLNRVQRYLHEQVEKQRRETGKVRAIIVKGRQQGCSTYIEGRFYWLVTHRFGARAFILTHDNDATNNLFEMAQRYHEHCPSVVRPTIEASNAKELIFAGLDSGYKLGTAGNKAVGRSSTIQLLHGCLAENTKIYDPISCGVKNIQDFDVGDFIMTHTGKIAVISFISMQKKKCMKIKIRTLTDFPLYATKEHRFFTKDGWKKLEELKIGDSIGYPIFNIDEIINEINVPLEPIRHQGGGRQYKCPDKIKINYDLGRILGLYLANGHVKLQKISPYNPCAIHFSIHRKETDRTIEWLSYIKDYYSSIKIINRKNSLTTDVIIYGNRLSKLIIDLCGRTLNKHIPFDWKDMGKEFCRGILHGYILGDGGSYKTDGGSYKTDRRIRASSIINRIIVTLRDLSASLGYGWATIEYKEAAIRHKRNEKERFTFSLCGEVATRLAKEINKPTVEIKRKNTKSIKENAASGTEISDGYAWLRIREIEKVGTKKVYDFEVNHNDHSYCTIHGATHNSEVAYWPNASEHAKGILQAVPNDRNTEIFIESTANGIGNYFHEQWQLAEAKLSDFIPVFLPWYWQEEYIRHIDDDFKVNEEEEELIRIYDVTKQQLSWRRYKITELSVGGTDGTKAFMQEYPFTATEAFQTSGDDTFISPSLVMRARKGQAERYGGLIIGVDPARFGDDRTSIIRRMGRCAYNLQSYAKKDTMEVVGYVHRIIVEEKPYKVCIDIGGLGAGIYDRLLELGHREIVVAVNFGSTPLDQKKYLNKRAEMWGLMHNWLRDEPCDIPDLDSLHADLCGIKYKIDSNSRIVIERKEDMKKRGIRSPDEADALALTFACPNSAIIESRSKGYKEVAKNVMSSFNHVDRLRKAAYKK